MTRFGKSLSITFLLVMFAGAFRAPAATNSVPDFREVYDSIRAHVHAAGVDDAELNRAAVLGLLKELGPKASLVISGQESPPANIVTQLTSKALVFEDDIAYLRVARVANGLAAELRGAYQTLGESNKLNGVILDLRFTDGSDYATVLGAAELFALKNPVALDWGKGSQEAKTGSGVISVPLIVLANGETRGAAEALAAMLRAAGAGLILGNRTAGQAMLTQDFPLSDGSVLRLATAAVKLNGVELAAVRPDIDVPINAKDEQTFFADEYVILPKSNLPAVTNKLAGTNAPGRRVRLTEAELVRAHKQGLNPEDEDGFVNGLRETKPETPIVSDPVLARALDLLKGLAIVRQSRP